MKKRLESASYGDDLLGLMMAANKYETDESKKKKKKKKNSRMEINDVIAECKTFFLAGHETTATLLTWTFLLLASNPEWQDRVREEVDEVCGHTDTLTMGLLTCLKLVSNRFH